VIALNERQFKATLLGAFIILSWAVLWAWSQTHYGQHSHQPVGINPSSLCSLLQAGR
jgi:hypothetical protein